MQDALDRLWDEEVSMAGDVEDGPAKEVLAPHGVTWRDWNKLQEPILEAVIPVYASKWCCVNWDAVKREAKTTRTQALLANRPGKVNWRTRYSEPTRKGM